MATGADRTGLPEKVSAPDEGGQGYRRSILVLILVGLVALVAGVSFSSARGYRELQNARQRKAQIEAEMLEVTARIEVLRGEIDDLLGNPSVLERVAREELGYVRPEDLVFVLPDAPTEAVSRSLQKSTSAELER